MITDAMIEAAATVMLNSIRFGYSKRARTLDQMDPDHADNWRAYAKAALEAAEQAAWRPIEEAPREHNQQWLASSREWQCPAVIQWVSYDAADAEELGEPGYWAYVENLIGDVAGAADEAEFVRPLPTPGEQG